MIIITTVHIIWLTLLSTYLAAVLCIRYQLSLCS